MVQLFPTYICIYIYIFMNKLYQVTFLLIADIRSDLTLVLLDLNQMYTSNIE